MTQSSPTNKTIFIEDVLASYLYVSRPKETTDPITKKVRSSYEVDGVFPASHPALALIKQAQRDVAKAAWGEQLERFPLGPENEHGQATMIELPRFEGILRTLAKENKVPLRDGNRRKKQEEPYTGNLYLAARNSQRQPTVVATRNGVNVNIQPGDPMYPFSGCKVNLVVDIWAQSPDNKKSPYGQRINCQFCGIQLLTKGTPIGGGGRTADLNEFGLVSADADGAAPGGTTNPGGESLV